MTNVAVTAWSKHRLTSQVYHLAITRASPAAAGDAKLSALQLSEGAAITFDPLVGWYWVTDVGESVESLTLTAAAAQPGANVVIEPTDADPDLEGHQVAFTAARMRVTWPSRQPTVQQRGRTHCRCTASWNGPTSNSAGRTVAGCVQTDGSSVPENATASG